MKVIVAGFSKTGTKTINVALTELGYNVYDYLEHFMFHYEEWMRIFGGKGSTQDFKKMYENVDAVVDHPAFMFWKEIHEAFPDAKIILTIRDEDSWFKSLQNQMEETNKAGRSPATPYAATFTPIFRKFVSFVDTFAVEITGKKIERRFFTYQIHPDPFTAKLRYRRHNAYVMQEAPKDKLLVYNLKDGWEPLCKFLDKDIPDKPFPHKNVGGKELVPSMGKHEFGKLAAKEMVISLIFLFVTLFFFVYYFNGYSFWKLLFTLLAGLIVLIAFFQV